MTRTVSDDGIMVDRPPSRACEVAPDTTDRQDTRTENSPPASSAKIISLEEMEDWQSLGDLDQSGRKSDVCKSQSHEQVSPVMNDQRQEETTEKELAESAAQQASTPNQFGITLEETSQENEIGVESSCQAEHSERTDEKDHHEVARKTLGVSPGDNTSRSVPVEEIICRDISKKLQIPCVISEHVSETSTTTHLPGLEGKDGDDLETSERAQHEPGENREELPAGSCSATFGTNLRPNAPDGSLCLKATENCFQSINTDITKDKPDLRTPNRNTTCPSDVDSEKVAPIPSLSSLAQTVAVKFSVMGSPSTGPSWTESTTPGDTTDKNKTARCTPLAELAKDRSDAHDTEVASSTSSGESTGECHAVQNPGVRVLLQSTLTDRVKNVNSGKKKTVSFADFLDSPSWDTGADADEGYTASRKAAQYGNAKMKSPPAEVRVFSWDTDSNETVSVQTTARNCSACGHRRTADSPGNCNIATGEVLLDKLTAFGYL
ncbi:uncharacterized protein LOC143296088 [Babylonia areolata]|uniref:uncharacterized protein LOC143296088 n=1 Tax=Babylonia areolata TaxID=304850 RepID=UPI003FD6965E